MLLLTENDSALKVAQQITFRELVAYKKIKVYANSYIWFQKKKKSFKEYFHCVWQVHSDFSKTLKKKCNLRKQRLI